MPAATDNLALVKGILDRMLPSGDLRPLLDGLADDGVLKAAVLDYFLDLGDLVTFWRVKDAWGGARVVVLIEERFILEPGGFAVQSDLALVFDLGDGLITNLCIVEDPEAAEELEMIAVGVSG